MSPGQERFVIAAALLQESAWLTALFAALSLPIGGGGNPIPWAAAAAIMAASLLLARVMSRVKLPAIAPYAAQMIFGFAAVYIAVGANAAPDFAGVDFAWPATLASGEMGRVYTARAALGCFAGVALWWRGGSIGAAEFPAESLAASFKAGMFALAITALVDIFHPADLGAFPMMLLFFGAGAAGLSAANMTPASRNATESRAWTRVIGGAAAAIVAAGLLFSLLQRNVLAMIAAPVIFVLEALARLVLYAIIAALAYAVDFVVGALFALLRRMQVRPAQEAELSPPSFGSALSAMQRGGEPDPAAELLLQILQWSIVAAIVAAALLMLALAYRRRYRQRWAVGGGERESVRENASAAYDFSNMLFGLLPSRFRKSKSARTLRIPSGDPDIADVFRIYFGLLALGEKRGVPKPPGDAPTEYRRTLETLVPARLARAATRAFNRACYGHQPAPRAEIDEMRRELEREAASK